MASYFFLPNLDSSQLYYMKTNYTLQEEDPHFNDLVTPGGFSRLRQQNDKETPTILTRDKMLDHVTAADKFYVFGHGDYRTGELYTKATGGLKVSMYGLATLLLQRKLPDLDGLTVRLFACTSSVTDGSGGPSMAQRLAMNLGLLNYKHLRVKGYTGFVNLGDGKNLFVTKEYDATAHKMGKTQLAKDNCVSYEMGGKIISGHEGVGRQRTTLGNKHTKFRISRW